MYAVRQGKPSSDVTFESVSSGLIIAVVTVGAHYSSGNLTTELEKYRRQN
jgi:hypothetical protein